jgi:hypothetical protein
MIALFGIGAWNIICTCEINFIPVIVRAIIYMIIWDTEAFLNEKKNINFAFYLFLNSKICFLRLSSVSTALFQGEERFCTAASMISFESISSFRRSMIMKLSSVARERAPRCRGLSRAFWRATMCTLDSRCSGSSRICPASCVQISSTDGKCGIMSSSLSLVCILFSLECEAGFGTGISPHIESPMAKLTLAWSEGADAVCVTVCSVLV